MRDSGPSATHKCERCGWERVPVFGVVPAIINFGVVLKEREEWERAFCFCALVGDSDA